MNYTGYPILLCSKQCYSSVMSHVILEWITQVTQLLHCSKRCYSGVNVRCNTRINYTCYVILHYSDLRYSGVTPDLITQVTLNYSIFDHTELLNSVCVDKRLRYWHSSWPDRAAAMDGWCSRGRDLSHLWPLSSYGRAASLPRSTCIHSPILPFIPTPPPNPI